MEKWAGCTNSLWVLCPISGAGHEEILIVAEQRIARFFYRNLCPPWPLILLLPPPLFPWGLVLIHSHAAVPIPWKSGEPPVVEDMFRNVFKLGAPGRKAAEFALSSAKAVLNQRQKSDYQVNLPCFEEKHKCTLFPHFSWVSRKPFSEGWRHKHWSAECPRQCLSGISIYSHSGFGKVIVLLKQKKETEKKNIKRMVMFLYKIFCDKFSVKVREAHSGWIGKKYAWTHDR